MYALTHVTLYDFGQYLPDAYILFDETIREVGPMSAYRPTGAEELDGTGLWALPGLINFHTHIYSMFARGFDFGAAPVTFRDVLGDIWWRLDRALTLKDLTLSAALYSDESLLCGVTSLIDHNASGEIAGSLEALEKGLKMPGLLCFETSDRFEPDACLTENTGPYLGLHASLSLSEDTLTKAARIEKPIHIHVAESLEDETDAWQRYDKSVIMRLKSHGLLRPDSILAHCVNIDAEEARLIGASGAYVALNPSSNMNNAVGTFEYGLMRSHGIPLLVGTDGLGADIGRAWQDLYYVGKQSLGQPSGIGLDEILEHIRESYRYFSRMSGRPVGRLEPGFTADLVVMDYLPPTPVDASNAFGHVFFGLLGRFRPESVFVGGVRAVKDYRPVHPAQPDHSRVEAFWKRIERSES